MLNQPNQFVCVFFFFHFFCHIIRETREDMDVRYACEKKAKKKISHLTMTTNKHKFHKKKNRITSSTALSNLSHIFSRALRIVQTLNYHKKTFVILSRTHELCMLLNFSSSVVSHRLILVRIGCNVDLCCMCVCSVEHWPLIWDWSLITSHIFGQTYVWNCADCEKSSWNVICIHRFGLLVITKSMWYISKLMQYLKRA